MGRVIVARLTVNPKVPPELLLRRLLGATIGPIKVQSLIVPPVLGKEFFLLIVSKTDRLGDMGKTYSFGSDNYLRMISVKTVVEVPKDWREIR